MAITSLGHVGIYVHDLERSKAFYRDILGLTINDETKGVVFMSSQDRLAEHHEWSSPRGASTAL